MQNSTCRRQQVGLSCISDTSPESGVLLHVSRSSTSRILYVYNVYMWTAWTRYYRYVRSR